MRTFLPTEYARPLLAPPSLRRDEFPQGAERLPFAKPPGRPSPFIALGDRHLSRSRRTACKEVQGLV